MLPCDVNPEKEMRLRFLKREADMRRGLTEAVSMKAKSKDPTWTIRVQFSKEDLVDRAKTGLSLFDHFLNSMPRIIKVSVVAHRQLDIELTAKSSKEAIKTLQGFLKFAEKVAGGAT